MLRKLMIPIAVLTAAGFFMSIDSASGSSNGISGYSGNPATNSGASCQTCHNGGTAPSVALTGPTSVTAGATSTYTFTITGGQSAGGGLDVSATLGTLVSTTADTKILTGEIVQNGTKNATGGAVSWSFDWTAPATQGTATFYAAGNSVNLANATNGDAHAMTSMAVTIQAATTPPATGTNQLPTAISGGPYTGAALQGVVFDGSASTDPDGTITSYQWDFGDGGPVVDFGTAGARLQHGYTTAGTYNVTLTVIDDAGGSSTSTTTATVTSSTTTTPPVAVDAGAIYASECAACHGGSGGGGVGPSLITSTASASQIAGIVTSGAAGMPGFGSSLTAAEIDAVAGLAAGFQSSTPTSTTTTTLPAAATGAEIYASNCASCHGAGATGGIGPSLVSKPANAVIVGSIVTNGIGTMPAFSGKLTADQIELVAKHIATIAPPPPTTTPGSTGDGGSRTGTAVSGSAVYGAYCVSCHGASGEGGIGPSLISSTASVGQISAVVGSGSGSMPSFGSVISADEITAVSHHALALQSSTPVVTTATTLPAAATGADIYAANCAACHGPAGAGAVGPSLIDTPASVGLVKSIVSNGIATMPAFSAKLSAGQIQLVADHVASIAPAATTDTGAASGTDTGASAEPATPAEVGATMFAQNCASCHGTSGEGGSGADLRVQFIDEELIRSIGRGPGDMPAFADILSADEIRLIADHVHTLEPVATSVSGAIQNAPAVITPRGPSQASLDINKRLDAALAPSSESPDGFPIGMGILLMLATAAAVTAWIVIGERRGTQLELDAKDSP